MKTRVSMGLELSAQARRHIRILSDMHGMKQCVMLSRLLEFFANQQPRAQIGMLGFFTGEEDANTTKLIIEDMARKKAA